MAARLTPRPSLDNADLLRLAPLLVGRARRGVLGSSRYARSLREAVRQASCDAEARPVLISGEPGLEKDNLAALIHFGSPARQQLMMRLDGALLRPDGGTSAAKKPGGRTITYGDIPLFVDRDAPYRMLFGINLLYILAGGTAFARTVAAFQSFAFNGNAPFILNGGAADPDDPAATLILKGGGAAR